MLYVLIFTQLLAHVIADFYCQTDSFCKAKEERGFFSWQLYAHSAVVFLLAWICSLSVEFWWVALVLAITHLILDGLKAGYKHISGAFFIDQLFHLLVIIVFCYVYYRLEAYVPLYNINSTYLLILLGGLVCMKPANIMIREIFNLYQLQNITPDESNDLPNAGKLIGSIERILAYLFVMLGQYEALGFLIAAKSLLRFRDTDTAKTEYVLVGTLLSFAIAVLVGVGVKCLI